MTDSLFTYTLQESSFGELMDCEESKETCLLKIEENVLNDPMKTENIIKTDGGPFIPVPLKTDVSDAEGTIETKDSLKVKILEDDFKTEIIKSEDCIKTLVIKLERIDDKFCVDGLKLYKEENCSNSDSKAIIYKSPMKTPDVVREILSSILLTLPTCFTMGVKNLQIVL